MRIALFGANGQVGRETRQLTDKTSGVNIIPLGRAEADLLTPGAAEAAIRQVKPDAIINAAAWTAVDKAESEKDAAYRINADAAGEIASAAAAIDARLVHISTDYVFDGLETNPLDETASPAPLGVYGASKLKGEELVLAAAGGAVILRTSWVYSPFGGNFVETMLKLGQSRDELSIVDDQIGGPTPASAIAKACLAIAKAPDGPRGLYHFQGKPPASWAMFAEAIFKTAGMPVKVNKITSAEYPTPAKRPLYTVLNCEKIHKDYGISQPEWRSDLGHTVPALLERMKQEAAQS